MRSHCCGIGRPLSEPEVRAMMLLRANVLTLGFSGIRLEVIELLCEMLNRGVCPVIPEKGSVGASGDLAPLAHLALDAASEKAKHSFKSNACRLKPRCTKLGSMQPIWKQRKVSRF